MNKDIETLNELTKTTVLLSYVEKVKKAYLDRYNIKIDLVAIKMYMEKFVKQRGANELYTKVMFSIIDDYYNENGEMKY